MCDFSLFAIFETLHNEQSPVLSGSALSDEVQTEYLTSQTQAQNISTASACSKLLFVQITLNTLPQYY
jgi:hypothetical protein